MNLFFHFLLTFFVTITLASLVVQAKDCNLNADFKTYNQDAFKGDTPAPAKNPSNDLQLISSADAAKLLAEGNAVFIDTRPATLFNQCQIKGAVNLEYTGTSDKAKKALDSTTPKLTKEALSAYISAGKTVVFYCNDLKCYRSLNAAIQSACTWDIPTTKIKWFGHGVPGLAKEFPRLVKGENCKF